MPWSPAKGHATCILVGRRFWTSRCLRESHRNSAPPARPCVHRPGVRPVKHLPQSCGHWAHWQSITMQLLLPQGSKNPQAFLSGLQLPNLCLLRARRSETACQCLPSCRHLHLCHGNCLIDSRPTPETQTTQAGIIHSDVRSFARNTTATALLKKSLVYEIEPLGQPCDKKLYTKNARIENKKSRVPGLGVPISYFVLYQFVFAGFDRAKGNQETQGVGVVLQKLGAKPLQGWFW